MNVMIQCSQMTKSDQSPEHPLLSKALCPFPSPRGVGLEAFCSPCPSALPFLSHEMCVLHQIWPPSELGSQEHMPEIKEDRVFIPRPILIGSSGFVIQVRVRNFWKVTLPKQPL